MTGEHQEEINIQTQTHADHGWRTGHWIRTLKASSQHRAINMCWLGLLSAFCIAWQATLCVCVCVCVCVCASHTINTLIRLESHIPKGRMKRAAEPTHCEMSGKVTGAWWEKICFRDDMSKNPSCPWRHQNLCFFNPGDGIMGHPHSLPAALFSRLNDFKKDFSFSFREQYEARWYFSSKVYSSQWYSMLLQLFQV